MEETKVEVKAVEEKPAKRPYNRQKKAETEVKTETVEAKKDVKPIKVEGSQEETKGEVKVANEEKKSDKAETEKVEAAVEVKEEEAAEKPEKKEKNKVEVVSETPEKPAETKEEIKAVLSIEQPEINADTPDLKPSYLIRRPIQIFPTPKVTVGGYWFVGVVRVLDKVDNKFIKVAYKAAGTGEIETAYILCSVLPQ